MRWTHDSKRGAARQADLPRKRNACLRAGSRRTASVPPPCDSPSYREQLGAARCTPGEIDAGTCAVPAPPAGRWDLEERVAVYMTHDSWFGEAGLFTLDGQWWSDDVYGEDFSLEVGDRFMPYRPSRAQLALFAPAVSASAGVEYFQRLGNTADPVEPQVRRVHRAAPRPHPAPPPDADPPGAHPVLGRRPVPGALWAAAPGCAPPTRRRLAPELRQQLHASAVTGLTLMHNVGPVDLQGRVALDSLVRGPRAGRAFSSTAVLTSAEATTRFYRRFGEHRPRRAPAAYNTSASLAQRPEVPGLRSARSSTATVDGVLERTIHLPDATATTPCSRQRALRRERLRREETSHQIMLTLDQDLRDDQEPARARVALDQPALRRHHRRGLRDERQGEPEHQMAQSLGRRQLLRTRTGGPRELTAGTGFPVTDYVALDLGYLRVGPNAGRFNRTMYELDAPPIASRRGGFVHYATFRLRARLPPRWSFTYRPRITCPFRRSSGSPRTIPAAPERGFTLHDFTSGYESPCECWASAWPESTPTSGPELNESAGEPHLQINFTLAGYAVGASAP